MSLDNKISSPKTAWALELAYGILPSLFLIFCWGMNITALPGLLFLWWIKKQGHLKMIQDEALTLLARSQWILSLLFISCFLIATELEKEIKHNALSEDHFLPILTMLPGFFAYGLKALAIISLVFNIILIMRAKIIKK
ncbi:MAG: hypothetical protein QE271_08350 [Bacteriovoracaceae bacterium]|nr:hypothetical protein [Bacteriovoracaceae bacterium]